MAFAGAEELFLKALDTAPKELLETPQRIDEPQIPDEAQLAAQRMALQAVRGSQVTQQHQLWTDNADSQLQQMTAELRAQTQNLAQNAQETVAQAKQVLYEQRMQQQMREEQQRAIREAPQREAENWAQQTVAAKVHANLDQNAVVEANLQDKTVLKFAAQATAMQEARTRPSVDPKNMMANAGAAAKAMTDPHIMQAAAKSNDPLGIAAALAHALATDQEFLGRISWYNPDRGIGVIECRESLRLTGDHVTIFGGKTLGLVPVAGDEVRFSLRKNQERGFKANNVLFLKGDAGAAASRRDEQVNMAMASVQQGRIVSYDQNKGFGFITCDALRDLFHKDIFFMKTSLKGSRDAFRTGVSVNFKFTMKKRGPEAVDVALPGTALDPGIQTEMDQGNLNDRIARAATQTHQGNIISYDQRGFGFISCPALRDIFGKDIFWMKTSLKGRQESYNVGTLVNFTFELTDRGPQANHIEMPGMPGATLHYASGDLPPWAVPQNSPVYGYGSYGVGKAGSGKVVPPPNGGQVVPPPNSGQLMPPPSMGPSSQALLPHPDQGQGLWQSAPDSGSPQAGEPARKKRRGWDDDGSMPPASAPSEPPTNQKMPPATASSEPPTNQKYVWSAPSEPPTNQKMAPAAAPSEPPTNQKYVWTSEITESDDNAPIAASAPIEAPNERFFL